jgi:membrane protein CcdC involved in cytochrome C biogenesis
MLLGIILILIGLLIVYVIYKIFTDPEVQKGIVNGATSWMAKGLMRGSRGRGRRKQFLI